MLGQPIAGEVYTTSRTLLRLVGARGEVGREMLPLTAVTTVVVAFNGHKITVPTVGLCGGTSVHQYSVVRVWVYVYSVHLYVCVCVCVCV